MAGKKRKDKGGDQEKSKRTRLTLEQEIENETLASAKTRRSQKSRQLQENEDYLDASMTTKILKEARKQQQEIEKERDEEKGLGAAQKAFEKLDKARYDVSDSESEDEDFLDDKSTYDPEEEINEEEERILSMFMTKNAGPEETLANMIMKKINAMPEDATAEEEQGRTVPGLDKKAIDVYRGVGKLLSRYTSGKVPKAFKVVVSISNWEEILYLTEPEKWSPNAVYQATRLFASNLNSRMAQRFYTLILLPRIREDIRKNKRLHFALYQSLKKSVYKPAAFYKGILFPLCRSGTCNLREAVIIGSIIQKVSIPAAHSGVAVLKLAEMEYAGTNSYFLKLLFDKKYAFPHRVLDAVVAHFLRFMDEERVLPVIWHQCLLAFVQRYKHSIKAEDKENLKRLMRHQKHYLVTPEIQRELQHSLNRGQKEDDVKTMMVVNAATGEDVWDLPTVELESMDVE